MGTENIEIWRFIVKFMKEKFRGSDTYLNLIPEIDERIKEAMVTGSLECVTSENYEIFLWSIEANIARLVKFPVQESVLSAIIGLFKTYCELSLWAYELGDRKVLRDVQLSVNLSARVLLFQTYNVDKGLSVKVIDALRGSKLLQGYIVPSHKGIEQFLPWESKMSLATINSDLIITDEINPFKNGFNGVVRKLSCNANYTFCYDKDSGSYMLSEIIEGIEDGRFWKFTEDDYMSTNCENDDLNDLVYREGVKQIGVWDFESFPCFAFHSGISSNLAVLAVSGVGKKVIETGSILFL